MARIVQYTKLMAFVACVFFVLVNCSSESPISGVYSNETETQYAIVTDSTIHIMCGFDTAFIYDLRFKYDLKFDSCTVRAYHILYSDALTRSGYKNIECRLELKANELNGNLPMAFFEDNDYLSFGGIVFRKPIEPQSTKALFQKWIDLLVNNTETKQWNMAEK